MKELTAEVARQRLVRDIMAAPPRERFVIRTEIKARLLAQLADDPRKTREVARLRAEIEERLEVQRLTGLFLGRRLPPSSELTAWTAQDAVQQVLGRSVGREQVARRRAVREPRALPTPIAETIDIVVDSPPTGQPHPLRLVRDEPEPDPPPIHQRSVIEIVADVFDPSRRHLFHHNQDQQP